MDRTSLDTPGLAEQAAVFAGRQAFQVPPLLVDARQAADSVAASILPAAPMAHFYRGLPGEVTPFGSRLPPDLAGDVPRAQPLEDMVARVAYRPGLPSGSGNIPAFEDPPGAIAHDVNNLLAAIVTHCDLLLSRHDLAEAASSELASIGSDARRASALACKLIDMAADPVEPSDVDPGDALLTMSGLLRRIAGPGVQLTLNAASGMTRIGTTREELERILVNLVCNARAAMPDGGRVTIACSMLAIRHWQHCISGTSRPIPPGNYVSIQVRDTGTGFAAHIQKTMFEPFATTAGTARKRGIGLTTTTALVSRSGGFIQGHSYPGRGSEFTLLFIPLPQHGTGSTPIVQRPASPAMPGCPVHLADMSGGHARAEPRTLVLVDDACEIRRLAAHALRRAGYEMIEASSAAEALAALEPGGRAPTPAPSLVVTDVMLPDLNGLELLARYRCVLPNVGTVLTSGYTREALTGLGMVIDAHTFLPKPFLLADLIAVVEREINRSRVQQQRMHAGAA